MSTGFAFRQELYGPWEVAQDYLVQQFDLLYASLSAIQPLISLAALPANSVLVTDGNGTPGFSATLPTPLAFGSGTTSVSRADGSQILPNAYATQAASSPTTQASNRLAHSFFVNTNTDATNSQVIEGYNYYSGSGTSTLLFSNIGNAEHGGTGTLTEMRPVQGGCQMSNTGGGTHAKCFTASPAGRVFGGTGTYTNGYGFYCGTFGAGFTNKYGVFIADAGARSFFNGIIQHGAAQTVGLGGGAAPTLGTIGATGPAGAAQVGWLAMQDSTGAAIFVPYWK